MIRPGDEVLALPSGRRTRVRRIVTFDGDLEVAHAPLSVTLTLEDEIDIGRGDMIAGGDDPQAARTFEATMVWFDGRPLDEARDYLVKHTAHIVPARVERVRHRVNVATLETEPAAELGDERSRRGAHRHFASHFLRPLRRQSRHRQLHPDRSRDQRDGGAGMILSAVEDTVENAADRLARLVRNLVPSGARLNLPAEEDAAAEAASQAAGRSLGMTAEQDRKVQVRAGVDCRRAGAERLGLRHVQLSDRVRGAGAHDRRSSVRTFRCCFSKPAIISRKRWPIAIRSPPNGS